MSSRKKDDVITFKADENLASILQHLPNRSEFIRTAILQALDATCPLCQGSGVLSKNQQKHWLDLARSHRLHRCKKCDEVIIICADHNSTDTAHDAFADDPNPTRERLDK